MLSPRGPEKLPGGSPWLTWEGHREGLWIQAASQALCVFKRFTLSGLLGNNRVNRGFSLSSWGVGPWEPLRGG